MSIIKGHVVRVIGQLVGAIVHLGEHSGRSEMMRRQTTRSSSLTPVPLQNILLSPEWKEVRKSCGECD